MEFEAKEPILAWWLWQSVHLNLGIENFEELTFGIESWRITFGIECWRITFGIDIWISLCQGSFSKEKPIFSSSTPSKNFLVSGQNIKVDKVRFDANLAQKPN